MLYQPAYAGRSPICCTPVASPTMKGSRRRLSSTAAMFFLQEYLMSAGDRPTTLQALRASGWTSKTVKEEIRANFLRMLQAGEDLFPGIIGYENTVLPEINLALLAGHD